MEIRCGNCRFWDSPQDEPNQEGQCRRNAPAPFVILVKNDGTDCIGIELASWPTTKTDDWCGEFQAVQSGQMVDESKWGEFLTALKPRVKNSFNFDDEFDERIDSFGKLLSQTADDLMCRRNFGKASLREVRERLAIFGLVLKNDMWLASPSSPAASSETPQSTSGIPGGA